MQECSSNASRTSSRAGRENRKGTEVQKKKFDFVIPITWMVSDDLSVKATSLTEAVKIAEQMPLTKGYYVDDSFEINHDCLAEVNGPVLEMAKIENTPRTELPLLIGTIKNEKAQAYLEEKLKGKKTCQRSRKSWSGTRKKPISI